MDNEVDAESARKFSGTGDWEARLFFSEEDLQFSPEEYAARFGHRWVCFSLHRYRYEDEALGRWIRRFYDIMLTDGELDRCRQRFLTPEELARIKQEAAEDF